MCNFKRHQSPCSVESIVIEVGLSQLLGGDWRGANLSLLLTSRLFAVADAAATATLLTSFIFSLLGLHNCFGDLLSDLMLLLLLRCKPLLDLNPSLSRGSKGPGISLPLSNGNAPHQSNFLHPQPSGNNNGALSLLHSFTPDHDHSTVGCAPLLNQSPLSHPPLVDYSPTANHDHSSVALTSQPDGSFVSCNAFVSCNNCSASSCSSSKHNDSFLAEHMGSSSVSDHLSTSGHGCPTSCHLSSSLNDYHSSSADKVCTSDCDSSASRSNGSLSGPPVISLPGRSSSPTG